MKMTSGIYKITNMTNGKCYIGQSLDIEKRWNEHKRSKLKRPLYKAFKKYGLDNFSFEVLYECEEEYLDLFEKSAIILYNSKLPNGYNLTDGGEGMRGFNHSEETRQKIGATHKGKTHSEETKQKMSATHKGKTLSDETRQKIGAASKGRTHSDDAKQKIGAANKGDKHPMYGKPAPNRKSVIGSDGTTYSTVSEAMEKLGLSTTTFYKKLKEGELRYA